MFGENFPTSYMLGEVSDPADYTQKKISESHSKSSAAMLSSSQCFGIIFYHFDTIIVKLKGMDMETLGNSFSFSLNWFLQWVYIDL